MYFTEEQYASYKNVMPRIRVLWPDEYSDDRGGISINAKYIIDDLAVGSCLLDHIIWPS